MGPAPSLALGGNARSAPTPFEANDIPTLTSSVSVSRSFSGRRYSVESDESSDGSSLEVLGLGVAERFIERFLLRLVVGD